MSDLLHIGRNHKAIDAIIKIISIVIICVSAYIGIHFFKASFKAICLFAIFFMFFVLLPGNLILKRIDDGFTSFSTELSRSFFTGFALNIVMYYLTSLIGNRYLMLLICPLCSCIWIVRAIRQYDADKMKSFCHRIVDIPSSFFFFTACVFLFSMFTTQYRYIPPQYTVFSLLKQDFGFHAGIINALAEGYPPKNPWIDGRIITYHYFSEMLLSIPVRLLGVTSDQLLMSCTPYLVTPVFCTSMYSFFHEMSAAKERSGLYCLAFHFSNLFILKSFGNSWFLYHLYSNVNNAGLGISCLLTTIPLLKYCDNDATMPVAERRKKALMLSFMIMLMTGIKGPVALVLVGAMSATFILAAVLRSSNRNMLSAVVLSIISFCIVYIYVLAGEHSNASGGSVINFGEVTDLFFLKTDIIEIAESFGAPHSVALLLVLLAFIVFFATAFLIPFVFGFIREFILVVGRRRVFCFSKVSVYASCAAGFLALMILNFSGHSQVYFGFVTAALIPIIAFWYFEDLRDNHTLGMKTVRVAFTIMLCFFSVTMFLYMIDSASYSVYYYNSQDEHFEKYRDVSALEYEGLIWLRNNTPKDSLCASDRFNSVSMKDYDYTQRNNNTHFSYAIYSQRRQYLEGSGFSLYPEQNDLRKEMLEKNARLYDSANEHRGADAEALGVDYVIVSKRFNDYGNLEGFGYTLCFSNDEMDIYQIDQ